MRTLNGFFFSTEYTRYLIIRTSEIIFKIESISKLVTSKLWWMHSFDGFMQADIGKCRKKNSNNIE